VFDLAAPSAPAISLPAAEIAAGRFPALANCVAARPSGTEPKIKFYLFAAAPPCDQRRLAATKSELTERLDLLERDLRALAGV
jgi:phosphoglucomutase/phosphomannomutase